MEQEFWTTDEIETVVSGLFTTRHSLQTATGIMGELTLLPLRWNDVFRFVDGRKLVVKRTNWWRGWHELWENEVVLGSARPRGMLRREIIIQFGGEGFVLKPAGFWSRRWYLTDGAGTPLLEIRPRRGIFRRGALLTILGTVDAALLVLTYYLVFTRWRQESAAAAS